MPTIVAAAAWVGAGRANVGHPSFAVARAHGLLVLTLRGDRISALTRFLDNALLPAFGLPRSARLD